MKTTIQRIANLENVNKEADQKALDEKTISLKEVYERVVALETKLEFMFSENKNTRIRFTNFVYTIVGFQIANLVVSLLLYVSLWKLL